MPIDVHVYGRYVTRFLPSNEMTDDLWATVSLKNIVKGKPAKYRKRVRTVDGGVALVDSIDKALEVFGAYANYVLERIPSAIVVPIPSSNDFDASKPSRTLPLAIAVAGERFAVLDRLRFSESLGATHSGDGSRSAAILRASLSFDVELTANQTVILVDDVLTSGAHMTAAAEVLKERGAGHLIGLCVVEAVQEPPEQVWFGKRRLLLKGDSIAAFFEPDR